MSKVVFQYRRMGGVNTPPVLDCADAHAKGGLGYEGSVLVGPEESREIFLEDPTVETYESECGRCAVDIRISQDAERAEGSDAVDYRWGDCAMHGILADYLPVEVLDESRAVDGSRCELLCSCCGKPDANEPRVDGVLGSEPSSDQLQQRVFVGDGLEARPANMVGKGVLEYEDIVADSVHVLGGSAEREDVPGRTIGGDLLYDLYREIGKLETAIRSLRDRLCRCRTRRVRMCEAQNKVGSGAVIHSRNGLVDVPAHIHGW